MLSPLQLREYHFTEVSIVANDTGTAQGDAELRTTVKCGQLKEKECFWRVSLRLEILGQPEKPFAYRGTVAISALFEVHPNLPAQEIPTIVRVNGSSVLYGAIREMILNITARSSKGPLLLPTLDMRSTLQEAKKPLDHAHDRPKKPRSSAKKPRE